MLFKDQNFLSNKCNFILHVMNNQTLLFTISNSRCIFVTNVHVPLFLMLTKENRIYVRVEFRHSLGMNFVSPF